MAASQFVILCEEYGKKTDNEKHQFAPGAMLFCVQILAGHNGYVRGRPLSQFCRRQDATSIEEILWIAHQINLVHCRHISLISSMRMPLDLTFAIDDGPAAGKMISLHLRKNECFEKGHPPRKT